MKYLKYLLKKRIPVLIALFFTYLVIFLVYNRGDEILIITSEGALIPGTTIFFIYSFMLCIIATLVPIGEFSFKMKKISIEQAFALPIKRRTLFLYKYLFSLFEVLVPFTLAYIVSVMVILCQKNVFIPSIFLLYYVLVILGAILLIGIVAFIYCLANNMLDGIVFVLGGIAAVAGVILILNCLFKELDIYSGFTLYSPIDSMSTWLNHVIVGDRFTDSEYVLKIVCACLYFVAGIALTTLLIVFSPRYKAEDVTKKSNAPMVYPYIITMYPLLLILLTNDYFMVALACVLCYFGYVLYRRSFILGKKYWIIFGISLVIQIIIGILLASNVTIGLVF